MATAYRYYRLLFTKNAVDDLRYYAVNTWNMYEAADLSGLDVAIGGTVTSSGIYSTQLATYANDNNDTTYWESDNRVTAGSNSWLKLTLASAVIVRSFRLISTAYPNEKPRDFLLQGSNDDSNWETIASYVDFLQVSGATERTATPWVKVSGTSRQSDGSASARVLIHKWSTGELLGSVVPDTDGLWNWPAPDLSTVLVTHIGATGYRPICDGPVTPAEA